MSGRCPVPTHRGQQVFPAIFPFNSGRSWLQDPIELGAAEVSDNSLASCESVGHWGLGIPRLEHRQGPSGYLLPWGLWRQLWGWENLMHDEYDDECPLYWRIDAFFLGGGKHEARDQAIEDYPQVILSLLWKMAHWCSGYTWLNRMISKAERGDLSMNNWLVRSPAGDLLIFLWCINWRRCSQYSVKDTRTHTHDISILVYTLYTYVYIHM